jgi:hypothetical protein
LSDKWGGVIRSCYAIEKYLGTGEYFNEDTRILREDNSTSYHYPNGDYNLPFQENLSTEGNNVLKKILNDWNESPYNYKENNPPGQLKK